jgi:hypothetical protein
MDRQDAERNPVSNDGGSRTDDAPALTGDRHAVGETLLLGAARWMSAI